MYNFNHEQMLNHDTESLIKFLSEKIFSYEEIINSSYVNIKAVIKLIEEEFPQIDIDSFSEFYLICEEYFDCIQHLKMILKKTQELNRENEVYRNKNENLRRKKNLLKSQQDNLIEENKYKDTQIQKLQEEISSLTNDYVELSGRMVNVNDYAGISGENNSNNNIHYKNNNENEYPNFSNLLLEIKNLKDDRNTLKQINTNLTNNLEKLENDLKEKYITRHDSEKVILKLEAEKNGFISKLKISEMNSEKLKKEIQSLKLGNLEFKIELERTSKKLEELSSHKDQIQVQINSYDTENLPETPLNFLLQDEENLSELEKNHQSKKTLSKLQRRETNEVIDSVSSFKIRPDVAFDNKFKLNTVIIEESTEPDNKITHVQQRKYSKNSIINSNSSVSSLDEFSNSKFLKNHINNEDYLNNSNESARNNFSSKENTPSQNKKPLELNITSKDIVRQMSQNDFKVINLKQISVSDEEKEKEGIKLTLTTTPILLPASNIFNKNINSNFNAAISSPYQGQENISKTISNKKKSLIKCPENYNDDVYREFFILTYQALKINSINIEPFLYLNSDKLYKLSIDNCIPYHKYYDFIKNEIKIFDEKLNSKNNYMKTKYDAVFIFLTLIRSLISFPLDYFKYFIK